MVVRLPILLPFTLDPSPGAYLPLLFTVKVRSFDPAFKNDLGNLVEHWDDPVEKDVYGWGPPQMTTPKEVLSGGSRVVVEVELLVPPAFFAKDKDRVQLGSRPEIWRVVGPMETYDANPFGWNPGSVVNLVHVAGAT